MLLAAHGLDAAIDDELLNIDFKVVSFQTDIPDAMGFITENSNGAQFSERQKVAIRRLQPGKKF